jgi:hypothetical protein
LLKVWTLRRVSPIPADLLLGGYGIGLDFHFRYAKFCLSSYALRFIQGHPNSLTSSEAASVKECMQYALGILDWTMNLSPVGKDALRYMSDFGFVMITFAALFVVQVCQNVRSVYAELEGALGRVSELAELMIDLAVGSGHFTAQLGRSLQLRVTQVREQTSGEAHAPDDPQTQTTIAQPGLDADQVEGDAHADGSLDESTLWDPTAWLNEFLIDAGDWGF